MPSSKPARLLLPKRSTPARIRHAATELIADDSYHVAAKLLARKYGTTTEHPRLPTQSSTPLPAARLTLPSD